MTHRAEQILDQVVTLIRAQANLYVPSSNVFAKRTLTLDDNESEMPAITVNDGDDDPLSEYGVDNLSVIDSLLFLSIVGYAKEDTEPLVKTELFNQRRRIHQALFADATLGLSFVPGIRYGGASAMEFNANTGKVVGRYETRLAVHYRQNITDPGDA